MINNRQGFESNIPVESNIILFRYQPDKINQLTLREKLIKTGSFYITSTEVKGVRYLRLVIMQESSTAEHIEALLDKITEVAEGLN